MFLPFLGSYTCGYIHNLHLPTHYWALAHLKLNVVQHSKLGKSSFGNKELQSFYFFFSIKPYHIPNLLVPHSEQNFDVSLKYWAPHSSQNLAGLDGWNTRNLRVKRQRWGKNKQTKNNHDHESFPIKPLWKFAKEKIIVFLDKCLLHD